MLITIILTCYKQEKYIEDTILSVVNQGYKNWELLIGDDSPDDECWNIISKYTKKYPDKVHAWHHNPNKGIVNNMSFLINKRNKESEFIAFLEGDDCLFPEYLEKKLEIFKKYPNIQLVYNELTTINERSNIIVKKYLKGCIKKFYKEGKIDYNVLVGSTIYVSWSTLMVRSGMVEKYNFAPNFLGEKTIISDIYFFNQIAHYEDIYGIEEPLVYYRLTNNSTSKSIDGGIKYNIELIEYYKYLFNKGDIDKLTFNKRVNKRYLLICTMSLKKSLNIGIFSTLKLFTIECFLALKGLLKKRE